MEDKRDPHDPNVTVLPQYLTSKQKKNGTIILRKVLKLTIASEQPEMYIYCRTVRFVGYYKLRYPRDIGYPTIRSRNS